MIGMLQNCGYDWFDEDYAKFEKECNNYKTLLKQDVKRVFALAVSEAIQKNFKVKAVVKEMGGTKGQTTYKLNGGMLELLKRGIDKSKKKQMNDYFSKLDFVGSPTMTSPVDLAKYLKPQEEVPQTLVKNMIQYQFDIKWDSHASESDSQPSSGSDEDCLEPVGEPADFTFYEFCKMENTTQHFKYIPRQAHVKATLYKECFRKPKREKKNLYDPLGNPKNYLCPTVYFKVDKGWTKFEAYNKVTKDERFSDLQSLSEVGSWIDNDILKFIEENADIQEYKRRDQPLKKHTLYWAVIKDKDFSIVDSDILNLKRIGETQVYVGKADNGIKGRWINDSKSHCNMMKKCLDNLWAMTTYDPLRLEGISLVDARLALAKVRGEKTALFVIKTFGDNSEKKKIAKAKLHAERRESLRQLTVPYLFSHPRRNQEAIDETFTMSDLENGNAWELESLRDEIDEPKEELRHSTAKPKDQLEYAEKSHQN